MPLSHALLLWQHIHSTHMTTSMPQYASNKKSTSKTLPTSIFQGAQHTDIPTNNIAAYTTTWVATISITWISVIHSRCCHIYACCCRYCTYDISAWSLYIHRENSIESAGTTVTTTTTSAARQRVPIINTIQPSDVGSVQLCVHSIEMDHPVQSNDWLPTRVNVHEREIDLHCCCTIVWPLLTVTTSWRYRLEWYSDVGVRGYAVHEQ
jgi:hypothetical protein